MINFCGQKGTQGWTISILTHRGQQSWVFLKTQKILPKMQESKNTQVRNELFSKCLARYDNKEELCSLKYLIDKTGH